MRLVRLAALWGSVVLLAATSVSLFHERDDQIEEQYIRVGSAAQLGSVSVLSTVNRAMALVEASNELTELESLTSSLPDSTEACVATDVDQRCSGADLGALPGVGDLTAASIAADGPALGVDNATGALLVVDSSNVMSILRIPSGDLIGPLTAEALVGYNAEANVELSTTPVTEFERGEADANDGSVVVAYRFSLPGGDISAVVTASIPDEVGLVGHGLGWHLALLVLGTVLLALATWGFVLDRRTLERRATTDELTGLVNRREFERQTDEALLNADRFNTGVCVMLIDLNGFKEINDTRGHQVGDLVLQSAAERLRRAVRETDLVARWGGDEFVVLLPGIEDGTGVRASAERIWHSLADSPITSDITISAAIGAALSPRHGTTLDGLVRAADVAMYNAKTTGVTYRIADMLDAEHGNDVRSDSGYEGPDRRRPGEQSSDDDAVRPEAHADHR